MCPHRWISLFLTGSKNQNEVETLRKVALKFLSHEELSCWQIWKQVARDLTRCLQKKSSQSLPGNSIQFSENENDLVNHKGGSSCFVENQEFLVSRTQDFCGNIYLSKTQNQIRGKQILVKNNPHICEAFMKKSLLSDIKIDTEQKPYKSSECGKSLSDGFNLCLPFREKLRPCSECGKGFTYSSLLSSHRSVCTGEKCSSQNLHLQTHQRIPFFHQPPFVGWRFYLECSTAENTETPSSLPKLIRQRFHVGRG